MSSPANPTEREATFEPLAEEFFSSPPPAEIEVEDEAWDQPAMSAGNRRAMRATVALLGCGAAAVLGFAALSEWILVTPAKLGGAASQASLSSWTAPAQTQASSRPPLVEDEQRASAEPVPARREAQPALPVAATVPQVANPAAVAASFAELAAPAGQPVELVSAVARPARARARRTVTERAPAGPAAGSADDSLTQRAYSALARGRASEAELLAKRALASDGTRAAAYIVLAGARDALGNREGARAAFRDCVQRARDAQVSTCRTLAR